MKFGMSRFFPLMEENEEPGQGGGEGTADPLSEMRASDLLPAEFQGRDPAEVKLLLSQMPRIVQAQKQELENLRLQMGGAGAATVTHGGAPPEPQKTPEEEQKEFEELFDTNPREAIRKFVEREYGPRFSGVENQIGSTQLQLVKQQIPDFDEFEEEVTALLHQSGAPATQQNIMGAYTMAVGNREIQKRQQRLRLAESEPITQQAPTGEEKPPELSPLQAEVSTAMGLSPEEFVKYSDAGSFDLKIRT